MGLTVGRKAVCKRMQHCWKTIPNIVGSCCIPLYVAKSLTGFKLCASTNMQQGVQTDATCNIQLSWEFLANDVASVCTGLNRAKKF